MNKDRGLIKLIVLIVIALIILGYFGINVRSAVESPTTQENLSYFKQVIIWVWQHILKVPVMFIWNQVLLPVIHMISSSTRG